ncbi:FecR domain-containing protein [Pseudomonas sp. LJDD11]|uniref:FecR family protein n=1 Tax=unclassified Pseudomonas TaxID=196821 RepID=UPI0006965CC0|nr:MULTISPECIES: FecR domain-containing protein [unclassified Pseudomonas]MCQ9422290.1 FecR domain-containing protein [Pseudomonas sp. LJDD11]
MTEGAEKNLKKIAAHPSFACQGHSVPPSPTPPTAGAMPDMSHAEPRQARLDIALDWLLRVRQAPQDAHLRAQFRQWQQADAQNAEAARKAEQVWQLTGQMQASTAHLWPAVPPAASAAPITPLSITPAAPLPARPRRRRTLAWAASAALAACLTVMIAPELGTRLQADYLTAQGERREVQLPDGSLAVLDSGSALAVDYSGERRSIHLLSGQAFFQVRPDPGKPFTVHAKDLDVTVTGTAFNVDVDGKHIEVAVQHGSVKVQEPGSSRLLSAGLTVGQRLVFDRDKHLAQLDTLPAGRIASWRNGQLIAENARLGDVVEQLRRYLPGKVWLRDQGLAEQRITGVYDTRNPHAALRAMAQPHGAQLSQWSPWLLVISR